MVLFVLRKLFLQMCSPGKRCRPRKPASSYGLDHAKMCFMLYANNKGADQPTHLRSLITIFVVHDMYPCSIQSFKTLISHMHSHPMGLDVWFLVGPFFYFPTSCVQTPKALARLSRCTGSPEPSLVAYVKNTIISWAGSFALVGSFTWTSH